MILKITRSNRHNPRNVVLDFGTALVDNNSEIAKSYTTAELGKRVDAWAVGKSSFECPASTDIDNHGIIAECDLCEYQSKASQCCRFYYTCDAYRLSVRELILQEEQFGYQIVDWETICIAQKAWEEPMCEDGVIHFQRDSSHPSPTTQETPQQPTASATRASSGIHNLTTAQITENNKIAGVRWIEEGQSILYATWRDQRENIDGWWKYEVGTGQHYNVAAPLAIDIEVLTQLGASYKDEAFMWFSGGISPSGRYIVYNRLPQDHDYTPAPDELYIPPLEMWIANSDGSQARKLRPCHSIGWVIWLEQESRLIFSCGYEGSHDIGMISVDGSSYVNLTAKFGGLGVSFPMALSPDETTLALPDALGGLQIAELDSGEVRSVAHWGQRPNWSADGRRLYYQYQDDFNSTATDIHIYDVETATDSVFIPATIRTDPINAFTISPLENAAVFEDHGLWLMTWPQ